MGITQGKALREHRVLSNNGHVNIENYDQVRKTAIQDFCKTKLFKKDSIFAVFLFDTLHQIEVQQIDKRNFKSVVGKAFKEIVAVDISAEQRKYLLDTAARIEIQNKTILSRIFEKEGRLFLWYDNYYPLTDSTIKVLNKFHLIEQGRKSDAYRFLDFGTDDSKRAAHYYFCRNDLSNYKKVITNIAIGYYDPPNIKCK